MQPLIQPGDTVLCVLPPAVSASDQPAERPRLMETYVVASVYSASYGTGCTLEGLNPFPYEGYVLWAAEENSLNVAPGWYFTKLTKFQSPLPA